jgi:CHAT domain-containing protein/tetratricopeptide (TPR) repeat protein
MPVLERDIFFAQVSSTKEVPGLNSVLVMSKRTARRMSKIASLSLCLVLLSTAGGALSFKSLAVSQVSEPVKPKVTDVDRTQNGSPAALNLQQLPSLIDVPQTPESIEKVSKLEDEGEKLFANHIVDKALAKWQEAYGLSLEMKYSEGEGRALTNMCRIFLERGQFVKAKYMGENAIEVLSGVSDQKALGRAHLFLAQAYFGLDNPVWAGEQLDAAMKAFSASGGNNASDTARLMTLAATVVMKMGKIKESIQFYEAAATYYSQAGEVPRAIATHLRVIDILLALGLSTAALEEAEKAATLARSSGEQPVNMVAATAALANCRYSLGEFAQAKRLYEQVAALAGKLNGQQLNNISRANINLGYGSTLFACGEIDQARQCLESARTTFKNAALSLPQAQSANVLGVLEASQGNNEKAMQYLNEALELHNLISPKNDVFHIQILSNAASLEARMGRSRDARLHIEQAIGPAKKMKDDTQVGRLYAAEAEMNLALVDPALAEQCLRTAIEASSNACDDSALWREHALLAKIQLEQHKTKEARDSLTSALSFFRSPQAGCFPSPERISYPTSREDLTEQLVAMLVGENMTDQALLAAEQLKQETFINVWLEHGGKVRADDEDLYNELVSQRARLHTAETASPPAKIVKEWQAWIARFQAVTAQNRVLARLIAPVPTTIPEITKAIQGSHATILEYLIGRDTTVAFTLSNSHITPFVLPVGRKRLESQVSALLAAVPKSDDAAERARLAQKKILQALYGELIAPDVEAQLPTNPEQMVAIIPDGILFNLPFAALVNNQGKYFIEQHTITLASSMAAFQDGPPRYADDLSLVVASADLNKGAGGGNDDEANQISGLFEPEAVTRLVGKDADIKAIQEQSKGKAVVHIANDLTFSASNPLKSVLPLNPGKDEADQKVTADSLFGISIPSDLLVWSGTAINAKDVQGSALNVFTRGLNYAGVRNVLMSLWVEPDPQRTSELIDFYKNKQAGMNQAESLRKAELIALSKDPSPYTWAAFQLVGPGY